MSKRQLMFNNHSFDVDKQSFAKGGQGQVFHARHHLSKMQAVYKTLNRLGDTDQEGAQRLQYMIDNQIGYALPQVSAPLARKGRGKELGYITTLAPGVPLDEDKPRNLPQRFENAWALTCLWSRLESLGLAHGDVGFSNIMITAEGRVDLIDLDGFAAQDPFVPKPTMVGQHPMLAPEIRAARNAKNPIPAAIESDRFAWPNLLSCILFYHHPTDGLVGPAPKDFDAAMMTGDWPERRRTPAQGDTPITALGAQLPKLFDAAFSLDPAQRPTAQDWRVALGKALQNMVQHKCGQVFVYSGAHTCPWCGQTCSAVISATSTDQLHLSISNPVTNTSAEFTLQRGQRLILGRNNIPGASEFVSGNHLEITIIDQDLCLENLGRNGTKLAIGGNPGKPLRKLVTALPGKALDGAVLTLADTKVVLGIKAG